MAYTQAHLDALEAALASGLTRVTYEGHSIEYQNGLRLQAAIAEVKAGLALQSNPTPTRHVRVHTTKGT